MNNYYKAFIKVKKMKLIPMTDFVINELQSKNYLELDDLSQKNQDDRMFVYLKALKNIDNYSKFLKRPLELSMFIPIDNQDNQIDMPFMKDYGYYSTDSHEEIAGWMYEEGETKYYDALDNYQKAKEKVLFEGWEYDKDQKHLCQGTFHLLLNTFQFLIEENMGLGGYDLSNNKIENLLEIENYINFELTPTAINQIFN